MTTPYRTTGIAPAGTGWECHRNIVPMVDTKGEKEGKYQELHLCVL